MTSDRFEKGMTMLRRIDGAGGETVLEKLKDIAPDFVRYLVEFPFGDIYARPGLDLKGAKSPLLLR